MEDIKGLKFRTVGLSIDIFTGMGAAVNALPGGEIVPAMDRGLLDAAEFNNASSDRAARLPRRVEGLHAAELPPERRAVRDPLQQEEVRRPAGQDEVHHWNAVEAASADMSWKAIDRYSKDYIEMQTKDKVKFYKTPDAILKKQLEVFDQVAAKKCGENPLFKEIVESQRAFAERAVAWDMDTNVNRRMAYNHYFGKKAPEKKAPEKKG